MPPDAPTIRMKLRAVAADIKLSHSVFALPFALLATFLAAAGPDVASPRWPALSVVLLIIACMVLARTMAMAMNRWADRVIDADNPRTAGRAIPSGRLSPRFMLATAIACAGLFTVAAAGFWFVDGNRWPVILAPLVLAWLAGYGYVKRFTALCHLYLGSALAISPVAASIAVEPGHLGQAAPWLLAAMVICWVAGFDIIYALQDVEVDRAQGLHSIPAKLGVEPALWVSRALHAAAAAALVALGWVTPQLGWLFAIGVWLTVALLVLEHALVWRSDERRIDMAFFTVNGVISLLLGALGIVDVFV